MATPTNVTVLVDRLTSNYRYGDTIAAAAFDLLTGSAARSQALIDGGQAVDASDTGAANTAAKAFAAYMTAMLAVDKVNRGATTEVLS